MKRIAVIIDSRQKEGLRMSLGLSLSEDEVAVFVLDSVIEDNKGNKENIEGLIAMGAKLYTDMPGNPDSLERITTNHAARSLLEFDHIIRY